LTLWNRTPDRARAVGVGRVAASPKDAAADADVVLSSLYDADAVRGTYGELTPRPGQLFLEMSTAGGGVIDELGTSLRRAGAELLTTPILGSTNHVAQGTAIVLAGGGRDAYRTAEPVLRGFGEPRYVGTHEEAMGLKLL